MDDESLGNGRRAMPTCSACLCSSFSQYESLVCWILRVHLVQFQIQFLLRNDSQSNQNHFVKSFGPFIETFQIQ
jgi:hypothetical protein